MKGGFLVLVPFALLLVLPASATTGTIQPGDHMTSHTGCTLNFVFDGVGALEGRTFLGTAAHCVAEVGQPISSAPYASFGTVALIGDEGRARTDWALIEVKPDFERYVRPAMKGHPAFPTGVAFSTLTSPGDLVQLSGYGMVFGETTPTQEQRRAVLTFHEPMQHQVIGPVIYGDSGGPLVHVPTGGALGLHSRLCAVGACTEFGPTIEGVIAQAAAQGFTVALRTV